jgi:hypothetical protein
MSVAQADATAVALLLRGEQHRLLVQLVRFDGSIDHLMSTFHLGEQNEQQLSHRRIKDMSTSFRLIGQILRYSARSSLALVLRLGFMSRMSIILTSSETSWVDEIESK